MKKKLALVLAVVMVFAVTVGATLAWLTDTTTEVKNTFTVGGIDITLTETWNTDTDSDKVNDSWSAQLIPGKEYAKDPVVAVDGTKTNVDCFLFVKFEEKNTPAEYLDYTSTLTVANGWTELTSGVWYRIVKTTDTTKSWELLDGNKVTVKTDLTKEEMPATTATPELVYTAYAIQTEGFAEDLDNVTSAEAQAAWAEVSN